MDSSEDVLDLTGLKCPLPALLARRHLARAAAGTIVIVPSDDPMAFIDVPHMCTAEGFEILNVVRDGDKARMRLRRP